jgi:hypothetical protein
VPDLQALRHDPDGWPRLRTQRPQDEEKLVLLGLDTGGAGSGFTEVEEAADLVAELSEGAVLTVAEVWNLGHRECIASRYTLATYGAPLARWRCLSSSAGERTAFPCMPPIHALHTEPDGSV